MKTIQTEGWALALLLGLALGCSREANGPTPPPMPPPPPPTAGIAGGQPQAAAERPAARMHHRDAAGLLLKIAGDMPITDPQRAKLSTLEGDLETTGQTIASSFQMLRMDLAEQVRRGAIDTAKVQADESAATSAIQAHVNREIDALDALHAMLDPTGRGDLVMRARSQKAGQAGEAAHEGKTGESLSDRLNRLTRELDLDPDQRSRVSAMLASEPGANMPHVTEGRQRLDAILDAFPSDSFDARPILEPAASTVPVMVREHVDHKVAFLTQLVPILRQDQRDKLASHLETGRGDQGLDESD
jgi:Spy/CpxP family protein refolding chaperone